jgi:hypothetical protein
LYFKSAALLGFASSKHSPPARYPDRYQPRRTHIPFFSALFPSSAAGPDRGAAVPGFSPLPESLANEHVINKLVAGGSLEVFPSRVLSVAGLTRTFVRVPLIRFAAQSTEAAMRSAIQSLNQPAPRHIRRYTEAQHCGYDNPLRVSVPADSRSLGRCKFRAMCSPFVASCIAVD